MKEIILGSVSLPRPRGSHLFVHRVLEGPNLKHTPEQGSLETLAEDDGRDHPAAATPGVVPAAPKRDRVAPSAESGPRASAADTEPGEGQEPNGRHTWQTSATCPASAGERRTLPGSAAAAPPPRPRATSTLRSNVAAAAPPAGRHFRVRRLATPTPPAGTSGSSRSLLPQRDGTSGSRAAAGQPPPPPPRRPVELEVGSRP